MNMTHKQGSFLFRLTGRKFWEPDNRPAPTMEEAGKLIDLCLKAMNGDQDARRDAVVIARRFFPDFDGQEIKKRFFRRSGNPHTTHKGEGSGREHHEETEHKTEEQPELPQRAHDESQRPEHKPEEPPRKPQEATKATKTREDKPLPKTKAMDDLLGLIEAGLANVWMHGPAGCGKTTICKAVAEHLGLPCTILSCSAGTSPGEFIGFRFPSPTPTAITEAIPQAGIIVLDEMPMLSPDVAAVANALLANGEIETVCGHRVRHQGCIIIATANTTGDGGNRQYIGNNQLDAATLDRFAGAFMAVDYDRDYESANYDGEVCRYAWKLRERVNDMKLRRVVSTRAIIAAHRLKAAGRDWKASFTATWTQDDKSACGV
jgi:MoxR-like ATPase